MTEDLAEIYERLAFCASETDVLAADETSYLVRAIKYRTLARRNSALEILNPRAPLRAGQMALARPFDIDPAQRKPPVHDVYVKLIEPVPIAIRSRAGMIANEARACLDSLACILARRNGKTSAGVYFPISASEEIFKTDGLSKIKKLSPEDCEKIAAIRPYRNANEILCILHDLDKHRKHIRLSTHGATTQVIVNGVSLFDGQYTDVILNGLAVGHMVVDCAAAAQAAVGTESMIATGVPPQAPASLQTAISFIDPVAVRGLTMIRLLRASIAGVKRVVDMFA